MSRSDRAASRAIASRSGPSPATITGQSSPLRSMTCTRFVVPLLGASLPRYSAYGPVSGGVLAAARLRSAVTSTALGMISTRAAAIVSRSRAKICRDRRTDRDDGVRPRDPALLSNQIRPHIRNHRQRRAARAMRACGLTHRVIMPAEHCGQSARPSDV